MIPVLAWLGRRLAEPSTHAAIAAAIAGMLPFLPEPYGGVAVAVFAALGFSLPQRKS